ncbi:CoA-binding protein [Salisediminibacterium halotolerans]|uniref:Predicted CoA-binding protein n=1 Tax=Salisediminibacterium halotolerans TaxID=517425 RepID=A0A1H9RUF9_9BACI|nr:MULTISPECIES: CoA-binding protein [Salisediminibacterium]RLJ74070.1 putative CoA-binding protein [Actinophytocola xinjiangensis]RPE87837.1 putative CoA-binding protein [Salisediminibacterium halotolerans]TWG34907.1 putative CoA-binding protein [Salisediminibacterium halotolerans]SER75753.1 Predicted CoA-binding protein [Salisediminibacterium haloalkalitolerans]GEL07906.1 CoA-binding protein [Salisediminibacterium halotolerans]
MQNPDRETIRSILANAQTIAVVGLSDKPHRTSYQIAQEMQAKGYKIIPVNPGIVEVLGEKAVASLSDLPETPDIINVFRRSEFLPELAEEAVKTDAPVFWGQLGVESEQAYAILTAADKTVVMDRCIKVDHGALLS